MLYHVSARGGRWRASTGDTARGRFGSGTPKSGSGKPKGGFGKRGGRWRTSTGDAGSAPQGGVGGGDGALAPRLCAVFRRGASVGNPAPEVISRHSLGAIARKHQGYNVGFWPRAPEADSKTPKRVCEI